MEVCIVKNMMNVAQNNKLEFQRPLEHHPFLEEGPRVEHPLTRHLMKDDVKVKVPNGTLKILIPSYGVVNWDGVLNSSGKLQSDHATYF
jgi:hypothetical protein